MTTAERPLFSPPTEPLEKRFDSSKTARTTPLPRCEPLPVILQKLGYAPLTFFKLYAPSYRCPNCGTPGLFVKVSANDGNTLTEFWDIEGPLENFENMLGCELHQGVSPLGDFKYEFLRPSNVRDHLDIFGELAVRTPRVLDALVSANLRRPRP